MKTNRILPGLLLSFFAVIPISMADQAPGQLVRDGHTDYAIVLGAAASPSERRAAEELRDCFTQCASAALPIVSEPPADDAPMIVLGCGPAAAGLGVNPTAAELGEQGYVIRTVPPHIVIAGTAAAGTLYGVYDFMETVLGVRWYAPDAIKTPLLTTLPLPMLDKLVKPAFNYRQTTYAWPGGDAAFRTHQRENCGSGGPDNPLGAQYAFDGICHTYFNYVSPGEFFASHPEYFSEIGGVRRDGETQLCLTNPEVLDIVTERMLKRMADMPNVRQHNFSQMDWYNYCQCPKCAEINERYGSAGGTQYWFVNQLAGRTARVYPDKLVSTLAYIYTEAPPKGLTMHPNTAVWLCHMFPCCDSHPIATCANNADYKGRAEAWAKICSHLYVWHYIVDFAHYYNPFPNFGAMSADMRFYRNIGVEGLFLQGMGHGGGGGEFSLLRPYYGMKLLWNPDLDANTLLRDFLDGYYGAAGKPLYEYAQLLQNKVDNENIHMHLYTNPAQGYLPDATLDRAGELFEQAGEAVKDDATLLERVKVARMPLTYARLFPRNGYDLRDGMLVFNPPFAQLPEALDMYECMNRHGFPALREQAGPPEQLGQFCLLFNTPMDAPVIQNEFLTVDVVPFLGGRALRITDKKTGKSPTAFNTTKYLMYPFEGGEETRLGGEFSPSGIFSQYEMVDKSDTSITLGAKIEGFAVLRTLALSPDAPTLNITTQVDNISDKPSVARVRSHLALDMGELRQTHVAFANRKDKAVMPDMARVIAGMREGEHYLDQNTPKGEWAFTGTKGLRVVQRFDDAQVDYTWLYAYPEDLNVLEVEVWAKPVTLQPKEQFAFTNSLTIHAE